MRACTQLIFTFLLGPSSFFRLSLSFFLFFPRTSPDAGSACASSGSISGLSPLSLDKEEKEKTLTFLHLDFFPFSLSLVEKREWPSKERAESPLPPRDRTTNDQLRASNMA